MNRNQEGTHQDVGKVQALTTKFFEQSRKFLKQDMTAAIISNDMGSLYARLGDFKNAKKMFDDSIDLTPDNKDCNDPKTVLKELL